MGNDADHFDVVIVGAGLSGINAAYRVQTELPGRSYTILESRGAIGGTWDLFRYPGIRSDSDLHTFGFPWRPWSKPQAIADGESIRKYMKESAEEYKIDQKIQYHHKLVASNWSSAEQQWTLSVDADGRGKSMTASFIILGTGYYDYKTPLNAHIPGIENFQGKVIHPQFWPEDLDYTGKRIIIIGSGATAITLFPNLIEKASSVTLLQRSPSYVLALPTVDPNGDWMRRWLPQWIVANILRWKFLLAPTLLVKFCQNFPNTARKILRRRTERLLPPSIPHDPHFKPAYNPWEQRMCISPGGDFFEALRDPKGNIVTGNIKTVTASGIEVEDGKTIEADMIVTATGLKVQLAGGSKISVDGQEVEISKKFLWKGMMLQDVPNACVVIGYSRASWTLGADTTAELVCRLIKHMDKNGQSSAAPTIAKGEIVSPAPVLDLNSTYIEKAKGEMPSAGDVYPWKARNTYIVDYWVAQYGNLTTSLRFTPKNKKVE